MRKLIITTCLTAAAAFAGTWDGTVVDMMCKGKDLASQLEAGVGDSVSLLTPQGTLSPMGIIPRSVHTGVPASKHPHPLRSAHAPLANDQAPLARFTMVPRKPYCITYFTA